MTTLNEAAVMHIERMRGKIRDGGMASYRSGLAVLSRHAIGNMPIENIKYLDIEKFINERKADGIKPWTVNRDIWVIKAVMKTAVKLGLIPHSPAYLVEREKTGEGDRRALTKEETRKLIDNTTGTQRLKILLGLYTGLRLADILSLRWENIDFDNNEIRLTVRKTQRSLSVLLTEGELKDTLSAYRCVSSDDFLFYENLTENSRVCESSNFSRLFKRLGIKDCTFHNLRHTFATISNEVFDIVTTASLLGHSTAQASIRYVHERESAGRRERDFAAARTIGMRIKAKGSE